jgi:mRNA-degrading endonuclease RelE of RelBE toxin-antitoxin system
MKIQIEKKVSKELKKLPPHIQKKYKQIISEILSVSNLYNINPKWGMKKMDYDTNVFRAKLDLHYRIGFYKNETTQSLSIVKVSSREDFNYKGSTN